jgi:hypothetical protein
MVDLSALAGFASSMNAVVNITKAMKDVHDANVIQTKVFELTREIMSAQTCAMAAQAEQAALLQRVRDLEEEKGKLETWNTEKRRYELKDLSRGFFAYILKPGMENGEDQHALCTNCYNKGFKSVIQTSGHIIAHDHFWFCPSCNAKIKSQAHDMITLIKRARGLAG